MKISNSLYRTWRPKTLSGVFFLEKLKTPKSPIEINWPLVDRWFSKLLFEIFFKDSDARFEIRKQTTNNGLSCLSCFQFWLGAKNSKSSPSDRLQTFRTIFGISCNRNHRTLQENKDKNQWFEKKCPVLMAVWTYSQPSNLSSALISSMFLKSYRLNFCSPIQDCK